MGQVLEVPEGRGQCIRPEDCETSRQPTVATTPREFPRGVEDRAGNRTGV